MSPTRKAHKLYELTQAIDHYRERLEKEIARDDGKHDEWAKSGIVRINSYLGHLSADIQEMAIVCLHEAPSSEGGRKVANG